MEAKLATITRKRHRRQSKPSDHGRMVPETPFRDLPRLPSYIESEVEFEFLLSNILCKNANNPTRNDGAGIEFCGCNAFDRFTKVQKLRLSFGKDRASSTRKIVHRRGADLTLDRIVTVQHRKSERHSLYIVA
jgi:hypothetical protein